MAYENALKKITGVAGADLSAKQYYAVNYGAAGAVTLFTTAGGIPAGFLQNAPESGQSAEVALRCAGGITKATAGAAISAGADVMVAATGKLATGTATNQKIGVALEAATADGDVISLLLTDTETIPS